MRYADRKMDLEAAFRDLSHSDPQVRIQAADALGTVGDDQRQRAGQSLRPLLQDENAEVRYTVALSLGELKYREALSELIEQMEGDGHPLPRQAAAIALGMIGDPAATPSLIKAIRSGFPDVRFQATTTLMQVNPELAVDHLRKSLRDEDKQVRASAIAALGELGDPKACKVIAPLLEDDVSMVRFEAAMALAKLGDQRGTAILVKHLEDKEQQYFAAEHLFCCPDPAAAPALWQILQRWLSPTLLKVWAAATLAKLDDAQGRQKLLDLLASRREIVRGLCIQLLGKIGETWARLALQQLANSPSGKDWQEEIADALDHELE